MITLTTPKEESASLHQVDVDKYELEVRAMNGTAKIELTESQVNDLAKTIAQYNDLSLG